MACRGPQSLIDPAGPSAAAIAAVWWWMLGGALLVFVGVLAVWLHALRASPRPREDPRAGLAWIVGGGVVLPGVAIALLLVFGWRAGLHQMPLAHTADAPLRIEVTGEQWAWRVDYPGGGPRLRNELRLPVGTPVDIQVRSADVIHSFWVPRLGGKIDAIPGRTNRIRLQADQEGEFLGPCAEFCGLNHAHMVMRVHAMAPQDFSAWLAAHRGDGRE